MRPSVAFVAIAGAIGLLGAAGAPARGEPDGGPPDAAPADAAPPDAAPPAITCEPTRVPGRVRCELEAHAGAGESIAWGDAVLTGVPPFATALRGRIGPGDALERTPERWRWAFALVARERGHGDLTARVRIVVCRGSTCVARELPVTGRVSVGPET